MGTNTDVEATRRQANASLQVFLGQSVHLRERRRVGPMYTLIRTLTPSKLLTEKAPALLVSLAFAVSA